MSEEIVSQYENWMRSWSASPRTIGSRTTLARSRIKAWGLDGFTEQNVSDFLGRPNLKKWTRATYHAHLTSICGWLFAAHYIPEDPMEAVRKPKTPPSEPRPLSDPELARVMSVVSGETRDWILLALLAGLRASEIAKIRGEDVSETGLFVLGKGEKPVTLPCHEDIWRMAQKYPRYGYWFPGSEDGHMRGQAVSLTVGRLFHSLGIEGSVHRVRHSYATRLLRAGNHVRKVQKLMRHSSLATTAAYTAVDEDELRAAIATLKVPDLPVTTFPPD